MRGAPRRGTLAAPCPTRRNRPVKALASLALGAALLANAAARAADPEPKLALKVVDERLRAIKGDSARVALIEEDLHVLRPRI